MMILNRLFYVLLGSALVRAVDALAPPAYPMPAWWAAILLAVLAACAAYTEIATRKAVNPKE